MSPRVLPPAREYDDLPYWSTNFDTVRERAINTAWNLLKTRDLSEISFAELAKEGGYTTPGVYQHYPTLTDFAAAMTRAATRTLWTDLIAAYEKKENPLDAYEAYFNFAKRRPRHYLLVISPRFRGNARCDKVRADLEQDVDLLLKMSLDRDPKEGEQLRMNLILTGGGLAIASGTATVKDLLALVTTTLRSWKNPK